MVPLFALCFFFAVAHSAVVPVEHSSVNVKHSGQDYSYTIKENHGIAIEPLQQPQIPVIRFAPDNMIKQEHLPIKEQELKPVVKSPQIAGMGYSPTVALVPTYSYLPAHQYTIPYSYGLNYPYNLITAF